MTPGARAEWLLRAAIRNDLIDGPCLPQHVNIYEPSRTPEQEWHIEEARQRALKEPLYSGNGAS